MICLMFSMLFRSIGQCSELLTFYWLPLPPPLPAPIPRIVRANSGILLAGVHSAGATGAPAETRDLSGIISINIRARHGLTVRPREKVTLPIMPRFVRDDFHILCDFLSDDFLIFFKSVASHIFWTLPCPPSTSGLEQPVMVCTPSGFHKPVIFVIGL